MSKELKNAAGALVQTLHAEGLYNRHPWLRTYILAVERALPAKTNELPPDARERLRALDDPAPVRTLSVCCVLVRDLLGDDPGQVIQVFGPFATKLAADWFIRYGLDPDAAGEVFELEPLR